MFHNTLAAALRNLARNRLYTAINILGLAIGLAAALLIALFVRDEFSYDTWIPGYERVYAVQATAADRNETFHYAFAPTITAGLLARDFPQQISAIARYVPNSRWSVRRGELEYSEWIGWAEPNLFEVLPLPAFAGNPVTALQDPDSIVLTRSAARKYFGKDNPIGETLEIGRKATMRVTAILEDLPSNTHLTDPGMNLGIFASARSAASPLRLDDSWVQSSGPIPGVLTYLRLAPGASADSLKNALPDFDQRHPRFHTPGASYAHSLMALRDIHLHAPFDPRIKTGSAATAYSALSIALLIVAIAGINFVNLTTARAARRAVEVGVRKVSGAELRNLIAQFIGESTIYATLGMALAAVLAALLLPAFNGFLQRTIAFDVLRDPRLLGALLMIVVTVGVIAGAYPAFVLSQVSPASVLKRSANSSFRSGRGRQALVALQFTVLIVLALVTITITRQAHFAMNEALRFNKDQMLTIGISAGNDKMTCDSAFPTAVRALPGVRGAGCGSNSLNARGGSYMKTNVAGPDGTAAKAGQMLFDFGLFDLFGIKPLAGRTFSADFTGDAGTPDGAAPPSVVINEALSRALGFRTPQEAIGKTVKWHPYGDFGPAAVAAVYAKTAGADGSSTVIGVVPDFALGSAREATDPGIFWVSPAGNYVLNVKLQGAQVPETLAAIDKLWKQIGAPRPIDRSFLDRQIEETYRDVTRLSDAMAAFAGVAIFVACLGLFGLASFAAETRTREIGVRKAMGAGRADILRLMLWEFNKPVLWASLVAWPAAYFIMRRWLEGFAVRVEIGLWAFPAATAAALVIAMLTVIGHALLVARAQPVTALRYE